MRLRKLTLAGAALALAGGTAVTTAGAASAATPACTSTLVHSHSVTSRGTTSDRTTLTVRCGHAYQQWAHGWTHSYTGAYGTWHSYKDGRACPGHWSAEKWAHSVSARGTARTTVTLSSGTC